MWLADCTSAPHSRLICICICLVLLAAPCALAQTSRIEAPVTPKPTVRSEIKRGEDAASQCSLKAHANYIFFVCLNGEEHSYQTSDPFLLGLFVVALATGESADKNSSWLPTWRKEIARIIKASKLTETDLCAAFVMQCEVVKRIIRSAE